MSLYFFLNNLTNKQTEKTNKKQTKNTELPFLNIYEYSIF